MIMTFYCKGDAMHDHDLLLSRPDGSFGLDTEHINAVSSKTAQHCNFSTQRLVYSMQGSFTQSSPDTWTYWSMTHTPSVLPHTYSAV